MVWSHVGTTNAVGAGTATPALPVGVQPDDLIVVTAASSIALTSPGYTEVQQTPVAAGSVHTTLRKLAGAAEGNPTLTGEFDQDIDCVLSVFRSSAGVPTLDTSSERANASTTATTANGVTVAAAGSLGIHAAANNSAASHTPPTGFTEPVNGEGQFPMVALSYDLDVPAGATGSVAGTLAAASDNTAHLLIFGVTIDSAGGSAAQVSVRVGI